MLNPIHSTASRKDVLTYEKEPYVMTADISYEAPYTGRGGWSWYTGSAGWMYQGLVKWFLGFTREADELILDPAVPENFGDYKLTYQFKTSTYIIEVRHSTHNAGTEMSADISPVPVAIEADGQALQGNRVKLKDDGQKHEITVSLLK
jgi:cellobiose phosphorylase